MPDDLMVDQTPSRADRILRITLRASAAVIASAGSLALFLGIDSSAFEILLIVGGAGLFVGLISGLALAARSLFGRSGARLGEALLTLGVGAVLVTACQKPLLSLAEEYLFLMIFYGSLLNFLVALGSVWGWNAAQRLGEERTGRRVLLLAAGWVLIPGTVSLILTPILLLLRLTGEPVEPKLATLIPLGSILCMPAWAVESRIRRRRSAAG